MRPAAVLGIILLILFGLNTGFWWYTFRQADRYENQLEAYRISVASLGLTDLCIATEARYTRHPAVSDYLSPFMDHPGAVEHFPTGTFWQAPPYLQRTGEQQ